MFEATVEFNEKHLMHSMARLADGRRAKVKVTTMGFSMQDRLELLKLSNACEEPWQQVALLTGFRRRFSRLNSATCRSPHSRFSPGTAR